ncbi:hypothetical protein ES319_D04G020700v1 [Gossypium barbadense]|uniref:Uncharacterized protein n=2 Tax=Gossypium TaxID=3633 RepID=A0A0D2RWF6_GOSRA|nr:hypothetical protein ES319_D04G020700v1 [Gossypium barbadense]KJB75057.1 hypothetical protein B456_012G022100 [Gossypium raimondii]
MMVSWFPGIQIEKGICSFLRSKNLSRVIRSLHDKRMLSLSQVKSSPKVIKIQVLVNLYPSSSSIAHIPVHCKAKMESNEKTKIQYLVHALKDNEPH